MKTFYLLVTLVVGFCVGVLVNSYSLLEVQQKEWESKINEFEKGWDDHLLRTSERVIAKVEELTSQRIDQMRQQEIQFEEKIVKLPELVSAQVGQLFPLEVYHIGDTIKLTSSTPPQELGEFFTILDELSAKKLPELADVIIRRDEISLAVNQLSPPQRWMLADQIELADWWLSALELIADQEADDELIVGLVITQSILDSMPDKVPAWFSSKLEQHANSLVAKARDEISTLAEVSTEKDIESLRSGLLLADWMDQSGLLEPNNSLAKIELRLLVLLWERQLRDLKRETFGSDEEYDIARSILIEEGASILESAVRERVSLPEGFARELRNLSEKLVSEQRKAHEQRHAEYQLWAIGRIQRASQLIGSNGAEHIEKLLDDVRKSPDANHATLLKYLERNHKPRFRATLLETAYPEGGEPAYVTKPGLLLIAGNIRGFTSWKNLNEMARALTADTLIQDLMVIDEAYLDRPVAAIFGEAFQKAWIYLEGTPYRLEVAKAGATISKKAPGDDLKN